MPAKKTTATKKAAAKKSPARKRTSAANPTPEPIFNERGVATFSMADAPTVENEVGGRQSALPFRFDLMSPKALFAMAAVLHEGAEKYGVDNWELVETQDHLNHALVHIYAWFAGDVTEEHLVHALCRIMFAAHLETDLPF